MDLQAKRMSASIAGLMVVLGSALGTPSAAINTNYTASWLGNSGMGNADLHVQEDLQNIWVAPDGTTYGCTWWDESHSYVNAYSSGGTVNGALGAVQSGFGTVFSGSNIAGNSTSIYAVDGGDYATQTSLKRCLRSNGSVSGSVTVTGGISGVAANDAEVYVSTQSGVIRVYDASTLSLLRSFSVPGAGRLALAKGGSRHGETESVCTELSLNY